MRTLGDLERAGGALRVTCINCGHAASVKARLLAAQYGRAAPLTAPRFRCTRCDRNNVRIAVAAPETAQLPPLPHSAAFGGHYTKFLDED